MQVCMQLGIPGPICLVLKAGKQLLVAHWGVWLEWIADNMFADMQIDFESFKRYLESKSKDIAAAFEEIDEDSSGAISPLDLVITLH